MSGYIDVSMPLDGRLPTWPGSPGVTTSWRTTIAAGDDANVTQLEMDVHSGTHVDAPLHFVDGGATVGEIGLDPFVGPAVVVDTGSASEITAAVLDGLDVPADTERLLLRTENSRRPERRAAPFDEDYVALTVDAARWIAARRLKLVGIDYLSIQRFRESPDTHREILRPGVCILEGLVLADVEPGAYDLVCLPVLLTAAEGAPARAILYPRSRTT